MSTTFKIPELEYPDGMSVTMATGDETYPVSTSPTPFDADVTSNDSGLTSGVPPLPIDNTASDDDESDHSGTDDDESDHSGTDDDESDHSGTEVDKDELGPSDVTSNDSGLTSGVPPLPTIDNTASDDDESDHSGTDADSGSPKRCIDDDDEPIRRLPKKPRTTPEDAPTTTALCAASGVPAAFAKGYTATTNALKGAMGKIYVSSGLKAKIELTRDGNDIHLTYRKNNKDKSVTKIDYTIGPGKFISNTQGGTVNCGDRDPIIQNCELTFKVYALYRQIVHGSIAAGVSFNAYLEENEEFLANSDDTCEDESWKNLALLKLKYIIFNRANLPEDVDDRLNISKLKVFTVLFLQAACLMVQSSGYTYSHKKKTPSGTFWDYYKFPKFALYEKGLSGRSSIVGYKSEMGIGYLWDEHLIAIFDAIVNGKSANKSDRRNLIQLLGQSVVSNKKLAEFDFGCTDNCNFNEAQAMQRSFAADIITSEINGLIGKIPSMIGLTNMSKHNLMLTEGDYAQLIKQRKIVDEWKVQSEEDHKEKVRLLKTIEQKDAEFLAVKQELQRELEENAIKLAKVQSELADQRDKSANEAEKERCNQQIHAVKNTLENLRPRRNCGPPKKLNW